jgi:hypothetical protein
MSHGVLLGRVFLGQSSKYEDIFEIIPEATDASSIELIAFWRACDERGGLIMNRDIPSRALSKLLHGLSVLEPLDSGLDFRIRLASRDSMKRYGRDTSGCRLSELSPEIITWYRDCVAVFSKHEPLVATLRVIDEVQSVMRLEVVVLPMLSPDRQTPWLLVGGFYS